MPEITEHGSLKLRDTAGPGKPLLQTHSAIRIYDPCHDSELLETYREIANRAAEQLNIKILVSDDAMQLQCNEINIWQDEPPAYPLKASSFCIYGCRLLSRLDRLLIAREHSCPLPTFFAATDAVHRLSGREWVLKKDASSRGSGVTFLNCQSSYLYSVSEDDVVMEYLGDCASTWKLDCFFNIALGCRVTMDNPLCRKRTNSEYEEVCIPDEITGIPARLGRAFEMFGCLYYSVDLMLSKGRFVVIEINTSSVGRLPQWVKQRDLYVEKVVAGMRNFLAVKCEITPLKDFSARATMWRSSLES